MQKNLVLRGGLVALLSSSLFGACAGEIASPTASSQTPSAAPADTAGEMPRSGAPVQGTSTETEAATEAAQPAAFTAPSEPSAAASGQMSIPSGHPRLWWNAERLARAKSWFASNGYSPAGNDPQGQAFHYLVSGDATSARRAIDWLMGLTLSTTGVANDAARWHGENAILVFDWCHDQMTPAERSTIIDRWNGYLTALEDKSWGSVGMEGNNYYWGYLRNTLEWGIATYHENPMAEAILSRALNTRWTQSFLPYASTAGAGGAPHEGSQYGRYALSYATIPLTSATLLGLDMWNQTEFFKQAVYPVIYGSTPGRTIRRGTDEARYEVFPSNDDETFRHGGSAESRHFGQFLSTIVDRFPQTPMAGWAQTWLDEVRPPIPAFAKATNLPAAQPRPMAELPLDYHAAGHGLFFTRERWSPDTTMAHLQLGRAVGVGHEHMDVGTFQLWRGGRWLSRETTGYGDKILGWRGASTVETNRAIAHNAVVFDGEGMTSLVARRGAPQTVRMESRPTHSFAAVDLTDALRSDQARRDNPKVGRLVREFLFIRPLETMVVFDRVAASGPEVVKSFLLHFETPPQIEGANRVLAVNGDQALRVTSLLPTNPQLRVIDEGGKIGQHRLEVEDQGTAESHFLHVLQARGAADPDLTVSMVETGAGFEVTLTHPTKGAAKVVLDRGTASVGGAFGYDAAGVPVPTPLTDRVQVLQVTDQGPVWQ